MRAQFEIKCVNVAVVLSFTARLHHREKWNHADIRTAPRFSFKLKMRLGEANFVRKTRVYVVSLSYYTSLGMTVRYRGENMPNLKN